MAKKEVKNNKDKTSFTKSFKAELKKVIWPTPKQLFNCSIGNSSNYSNNSICIRYYF